MSKVRFLGEKKSSLFLFVVVVICLEKKIKIESFKGVVVSKSKMYSYLCTHNTKLDIVVPKCNRMYNYTII